MKKVCIYSDGSALGNPGPGGYGTILRFKTPGGDIIESELSAGFETTTNNRMEILGVVEGLSALTEPCEVLLTSDSKYVLDAISSNWIKGWQAKKWKKADGKPVKNVDLWKRMLPLLDKHEVKTNWVKGHDGHEFNERCDALAKSAASGSNHAKDVGYAEKIPQQSLFS